MLPRVRCKLHKPQGSNDDVSASVRSHVPPCGLTHTYLLDGWMLQLYMMGMTSPRRTIAAPPLYSLRGSVTIYFQPPGTMSISYTLPPFTSLLVPLSPVLSHSTSAPSLFAMSTVYEFVGCVHRRIPCIIPTLFCFFLFYFECRMSYVLQKFITA